MSIEFYPTDKVDNRKREIQLLINIVEPDPEYQPSFISDEATFLDITAMDSLEIESKLKFYFKEGLPAPLNTSLWAFADIVKTIYPSWPDEWPPDN